MQAIGMARRVFVAITLGIMLAATAVLIACGNSSQTRFLLAADTENSRVLLYSSPFITGQSATAVLGQASATSSAAPGAPTAALMAAPTGVTGDGFGNFYVADTYYCRVLRFSPPFTTGMAASFAIGQPDGATNLTTDDCLSGTDATSASLAAPTGLAFDIAGNLWVADTTNSRVLKYPAPITAGEAATVALGQTTTGAAPLGCGPVASAATLCLPSALAFDSAGNLWVVDTAYNRVLMYPPANLVTGGSATVELGQPAATAFTSDTVNNGGVSATSLFRPTGLAFDSAGNLWVADRSNNRVLMYAKADLATNGAAATLELGQPTATAFTTNTANPGGIGPSTLNAPFGVAFDSSGRIFVSSGRLIVNPASNNRTLVFTPPFSNGMNATLVLGQADFVTGTANAGGESAATQNGPLGIATAF